MISHIELLEFLTKNATKIITYDDNFIENKNSIHWKFEKALFPSNIKKVLVSKEKTQSWSINWTKISQVVSVDSEEVTGTVIYRPIGKKYWNQAIELIRAIKKPQLEESKENKPTSEYDIFSPDHIADIMRYQVENTYRQSAVIDPFSEENTTKEEIKQMKPSITDIIRIDLDKSYVIDPQNASLEQTQEIINFCVKEIKNNSYKINDIRDAATEIGAPVPNNLIATLEKYNSTYRQIMETIGNFKFINDEEA